MDETEARIRAAIDAAHAADPERVEGRPAESEYANRLEAWVRRLLPEADAALRLAARAQHLERWAVARSEYPEGRGGYLRWRSAVHRRQGERIREIVKGAGGDAALVERTAELVAKTAPKDDVAAQALEDAACLVFLETELAEFHRSHDRAKVVGVLRKTWGKMSPAGRGHALALALPPETAELVHSALA